MTSIGSPAAASADTPCDAPPEARAHRPSDVARDAAFERLTRLTEGALGVGTAAIHLVTGDPQRLVRHPRVRPGGDPLGTATVVSWCRRVIDGPAPLTIDDTRDGTAPRGPAGAVGAFAGVPVVASTGRVLGVLCAAARRPRRWSRRDLGMLWSLAGSVRTEIELDAVHATLAGGDDLQALVRDRTRPPGDTEHLLTSARAQLSRSREETIRRLAGAIAERSSATGGHSRRMGGICEVLAERTGLEPSLVEMIRVASPLHDIGKLAIPDAILDVPGPLSADQRAVVETHAEIGHRMLAGSGEPLLDLAATIAHTHHERVDGGGYPVGLSGDRIPVEGRIAMVADVFDALTSDRVYRAAMGRTDAIALMHTGRGTWFDTRVLDALGDGVTGFPPAAREVDAGPVATGPPGHGARGGA